MSNVIQFLESLGSNPALNRLSPAEYGAAVAALEADDAQRQALMDRDHSVLNELLDGRAKIMFVVALPGEDDHDVSLPDDADGDGVPDNDETQTN